MQILDRAGLGFQMSLMVMVVGVVLAVLLLPIRHTLKGMALSVILDNVSSVLDYFAPASRPMADTGTEKLLVFFAVLMSVAAIYFVIRYLHEFDFSTKMVVTMLIAAMISMAAMHIFLIFSHESFIAQLNAFTQDPAALGRMIRRRNQFLVVIGNVVLVLWLLLWARFWQA